MESATTTRRPGDSGAARARAASPTRCGSPAAPRERSLGGRRPRLRRADQAADHLAAAADDGGDDDRRRPLRARRSRPCSGRCSAATWRPGGAGAINHYLDRERDARMARTRGRPLVSGRIEPWHGLVFGIVLGALATVQLALTVNPLAAALALAGLLGYVFVYTIWLKPLTPQNIVIGGAAGAVPPLVGWAAATGGLALEALYPFGIVFLWTPPHFWALSLLIKDDYARTGVPMLPVVKGEPATRRQILVYTLILVAFTLLPVATGFLGAHLPRRGGRARRRLHRARGPPAALALAPRGAAPLPLLARLPRPALLRDGRGPGAI